MSGTVCTGGGVTIFRLLSVRGMIRMEGKGLKGRVNATQAMAREFGLTGRGAKLREAVLARIEEELKKAEANLKPGEIRSY